MDNTSNKDIYRDLNIAKILGAEEEDTSHQQLVLYIPDKDKHGKEIQNLSSWIDEALGVLKEMGGGATGMPPADGTWVNPETDSEIKERTRILYTYIYADKFEDNLTLLGDFLHRFGIETNQGEVVFEFAGRFYRIKKFDKSRIRKRGE